MNSHREIKKKIIKKTSVFTIYSSELGQINMIKRKKTGIFFVHIIVCVASLQKWKYFKIVFDINYKHRYVLAVSLNVQWMILWSVLWENFLTGLLFGWPHYFSRLLLFLNSVQLFIFWQAYFFLSWIMAQT